MKFEEEKNSGVNSKNVTLAKDWIVMMMTRRRRRKIVMMMIMKRRIMTWVDFSASEDIKSGCFLVSVS